MAGSGTGMRRTLSPGLSSVRQELLQKVIFETTPAYSRRFFRGITSEMAGPLGSATSHQEDIFLPR